MVFETLELRNLSFAYRPGHPVLNNLNIQLPMNQAVWVQSVVGRSTFLRIMALLLHPTSGDYLINGQSVNEMSFHESVPLRLKMAYGFDSGGLLHNRTLRDNLTLGLLYHNICTHREANERAEHWLSRFEIDHKQKLLPAEVSGSQRKMVTLARALMLEPELLLLDEPSLGLGPQAQTLLRDVLIDMRSRGILRHLYIANSDRLFAEKVTEEILMLAPNGVPL